MAKKKKKTDINKPSLLSRLYGYRDKAGNPRVRRDNRKKKSRDQWLKETSKIKKDFSAGNISGEKAKKALAKVKMAAKVADSQAESEYKREQKAFGDKKYGKLKGGGPLRTGYAKGGPGKFRSELDGDLDKTGRAGYWTGGTTRPSLPRQPTGPLTMTPVRRKSRKTIRSGAKRSGGR